MADERGSINAHRSPTVAKYIIKEANAYAKRHAKQEVQQRRRNALAHGRKRVRIKLKTDPQFRKRARIEKRAAKRGVSPEEGPRQPVGPIQKI